MPVIAVFGAVETGVQHDIGINGFVRRRIGMKIYEVQTRTLRLTEIAAGLTAEIIKELCFDDTIRRRKKPWR